ncbi:hypothetical protein [Flavobacterium sp.]|uniref:hypothetical protein n=1 Tax=Flavobacterium sp. TaxID=239 RepID=UPI0026376BC2|nr:hypothetical protein [Flavobacterium sp.]
MTNKKSIPILIGIIGVLMMLLAGAIGYIMGGNNSNSSQPSSISNDAKVMEEIEELKSMYDSKIADKTNSYKALQEEKERVNQLVAELEKTKGDANALLKYKTEYKNLESKMRILVDEIVVLKGKKSKAISTKAIPVKATKEVKTPTEINIPRNQVTSKKEILTPEIKKEVETPKTEDVFVKAATTKSEPVVVKPEVVKNVEKRYSKVTMSNVKAGAFVFKSAGNYAETTSSNKTDVIKITFTLDANPNAKAGEKMYYFQVINGKNNVLGKKVTEFFEERSLTYSFRKSFDYNNENVTITQEFLQTDFLPGTYFVNIFDKDELVGKSSFTLK